METATVNIEELRAKFGDLADKEIELENESVAIARDKFNKELNNDPSAVGAGKRLLKAAIVPLSEAIDSFLSEANSGKSGRKHSAACLMGRVSPDTLAYITLKTILQGVIKENFFLSGIALNIAAEVEDELRFGRLLNEDTKEAKQIKASLSRRVGESYKKSFLRSVERKKGEEGTLEPWEKWDKTHKLLVGIKLIELAALSTGIVSISLTKKMGGKPEYQVSIDNQLLDNFKKDNEFLASICFITRPMVIPPKEWTNPFDGGYYSRSLSFVRLPSKKKVNQIYGEVDMPKVYRAVNKIQATPWRINRKVLDVVNQLSKMPHIPESLDFPSEVPAEKPVRPIEADTNPEVHQAWKAETVRYYQEDNLRKAHRLRINSLLSLAELYKDYDAIYFPHNVDFRGRVYAVTTLNPQGDDFCKGLLTFAKGKPIGDTGSKWLAFHGANCWGLDKKPIEERLSWVYENQELIHKIATAPLDNLQWTEADSPWQFLAWCFEWEEYTKHGEAFESTLPIAFDGSCSGIQHYSAMLRDPVGGEAVNLIPGDYVRDIYKIVADKVMEQVKKDASEGTGDAVVVGEDGEYVKKGTKSLAQEWLNHGITRSVTKRCVMTLPYGAARFGFKEQILEDTVYPALHKNPIAFQRPNQAATYMAGLIWDAVHGVVVKAMEAMAWLQDTSYLLSKQKGIDGKSIPTFWVTPAGFPVYQGYEKTKTKQIRTCLDKGITIRDPLGLRQDTESKMFKPSFKEYQEGVLDTRKQRQGIAPNFIHSMDASHLMLTVNACADKGVDCFAMIHDSYGTCAGDADIMYKTVREVFVKTYTENDVINDFYEHVKLLLTPKALEELTPPPEKGTLDLECVNSSLYAFS